MGYYIESKRGTRQRVEFIPRDMHTPRTIRREKGNDYAHVIAGGSRLWVRLDRIKQEQA